MGLHLGNIYILMDIQYLCYLYNIYTIVIFTCFQIKIPGKLQKKLDILTRRV